MAVRVRGHTRRSPNAPRTLENAQVYVVPPEALQPAEPIPKRNRLRAFGRALRPRRPQQPRTEMDALADEADEIARIIDGLGAA